MQHLSIRQRHKYLPILQKLKEGYIIDYTNRINKPGAPPDFSRTEIPPEVITALLGRKYIRRGPVDQPFHWILDVNGLIYIKNAENADSDTIE